jgi:hypothetical protein
MEKPTTVSGPDFPISDAPPRAQGMSLGTLHSFVDVGELRQLLGQLTTTEMLRMLISDFASASTSEP